MRDEVRRLLEQSVDARYLAKIRRLVPSGSPILGVRVPAIRALVKAFGKLDFDAACALADELFASGCREEMLFASFLLARYNKRLSRALWPRIDRYVERIDNWEVCDQLAMAVAGPIAAGEPSLLDELQRWTRSQNPWRRRFALATVVGMKHKAPQALAVCAALMSDQEPTVQKAVAWALREACKADGDAVFALLQRARAQMPPRVLKEAAEKLSPPQRRALGLAR